MDYIEINENEQRQKTNKDFWLELLANNDELLTLTIGLIAQAIKDDFFNKARSLDTYKEDVDKAINMLYQPMSKEEQTQTELQFN